ncbi:MAG: NUDIX pyrophosphatase [Ignavibacteriales bacterium]|jgi:dATP pyrophosphohydrolase|nr:NUDIX pyrophosphatase [Ignavibacteriaceae bacterium]NLH62214.1 NUDIX pyrophosphatase [Ignavibacteriales bacterium]HPO56194.1 NUDIX pyrophosphatase [Ignavibacteriaceae bacterium]
MEIVSRYIECHIVRKKNTKLEYLLLKRAQDKIYPGIWQMVSGKIENGEKATDAALRELYEETGLQPQEFFSLPLISSFYTPADDKVNLLPVFLAIVENDKKVVISNEHSEYIWVDWKAAREMLFWDGQKKGVDFIYENFEKHHNSEFINKIRITFP